MYYLIETSKKYPHQNKKTLIGKSLRDYPNAYSEWSHKDNLLNKACISCSYKTKTYGGKIAIINCLNGDTVTLELKHVPNPKEKKPTISIHVKDKVKNTTKKEEPKAIKQKKSVAKKVETPKVEVKVKAKNTKTVKNEKIAKKENVLKKEQIKKQPKEVKTLKTSKEASTAKKKVSK